MTGVLTGAGTGWWVAAGFVAAVPGPSILVTRPALGWPSAARRRATRRPPTAPVLAGLAVTGPGVALIWAGPAVAAALLVALGAGLVIAHDARRRRSDAAVTAGMVALARTIAAELKVGSSEAEALGAAAADDPGLAGAAAAARRGDLDAVVTELAGRRQTRALALAWRVRQRTGAPLASTVHLVEVEADARGDLARTVEEILAGPRASALVLAGLPLIGVGLAAQLGAEPLHFLFGTGPGSLVLLLGVALDAIGLAWVIRLAARAGPQPDPGGIGGSR